MKVNSTATNLYEWREELKEYANKGREEDYTVEVSAKLMYKILDRLIEAEWKYKELE